MFKYDRDEVNINVIKDLKQILVLTFEVIFKLHIFYYDCLCNYFNNFLHTVSSDTKF